MRFTITKNSFRFDKRLFFALLCVFYCLNTFILSELLVTKELYYQTYGEQLALEQIDTYYKAAQKWSWLGYVTIPIILIIKISFVAFCMNIGTLFAGLRIDFKKLFVIALISQTVFVIATMTKALWLLSFADINTIQDIQLFYPLSLLNFFPYDQIERWFVYPLQTISFFEVFYWTVLAKGLQMTLNLGFFKMLRLVVYSYGVGMLVWMVIVVFLSVNLS